MKTRMFRMRCYIASLAVVIIIANITLLIYRFLDWKLDWYYGHFRTILFNISEDSVSNYTQAVSTLEKIYESIIFDLIIELVFLTIILILFIFSCYSKKVDNNNSLDR